MLRTHSWPVGNGASSFPSHSFLVHILEEGKRLYGVGTERPMCVLMDRGGTVYRNGKKKIEKFDMSVMPKLVDLFRHVYSTFVVSYEMCAHFLLPSAILSMVQWIALNLRICVSVKYFTIQRWYTQNWKTHLYFILCIVESLPRRGGLRQSSAAVVVLFYVLSRGQRGDGRQEPCAHPARQRLRGMVLVLHI